MGSEPIAEIMVDMNRPQLEQWDLTPTAMNRRRWSNGV